VHRSLSLVLPIRNVQSTLRRTVDSLLESLSDLPKRLEVILIDDGSSDDTSEVASELAERYPQVKTIYHDTSCGWHQSIQDGLELASGEILLIWEENCRLSVDTARRLLATAENHPLVLGTIRAVRWPHRWIGWHQSETGGGFRVIVPELLAAYGHSSEDIPQLATAPIEESAGWRLVPVASHPHKPHQPLEESRYYRRSDAHDSCTSGRFGLESRPNFLHQIREFALGE